MVAPSVKARKARRSLARAAAHQALQNGPSEIKGKKHDRATYHLVVLALVRKKEDSKSTKPERQEKRQKEREGERERKRGSGREGVKESEREIEQEKESGVSEREKERETTTMKTE